MKLVTKAGNLHSALRIVGNVIEPRNSIPILGCVLIDGNTVRGTDLDMEITATFPVASSSGAIAIDYRSLARLVGNIHADETITIDGGNEGVGLTFEGGLYSLHTLPASDFPEIDAVKMKPQAVGDKFSDALRFVSHFVSDEETRYYLNGVCLEGDLAVATNGHVLGSVSTGLTVEGRPIIPRLAVDAINRIGRPKTVAINGDICRAEFVFDGVKLHTKLIDGTFPEWQRVVPAIADNAPAFSIKRSELLAAIRRMSAVRPRGTNPVTFAVRGDECTLTAYCPDYGTARERLSSAVVENAIKTATVCFDAKYLVRLCGAHNRSDAITFAFNDGGSPCAVTSEMDGFNSVVMPMRGAIEDKAVQSLDLLAHRPVEQGRAA